MKKLYSEITVKVSPFYAKKLDKLVKKRIVGSRAEGLRRALELLLEKYEKNLE